MTIEVELVGGIGNQLFGFAAGFAASERVNTTLILNTSSLTHRGYQLDKLGLRYSTVSVPPDSNSLLNRKLSRLYLHTARPIFTEKVKGRTLFVENENEFDQRFLNIQADTYIRGYFQSSLYFKEYRDKIKASLNLRLKPSSKASLFLEEFRGHPWTAVHVRRGDYLMHQDTFQITSQKYYSNAVDIVKSINTRMNYVVFSDSIDLAKEVFPNGHHYLGSEELDDPSEILLLMSKADNLIGSNSSLSWWSAFLSDRKSSINIFPRPWFLKKLKQESEILLPEWITVGN